MENIKLKHQGNAFKHGLINTVLYRTWYNIKARCYNPRNKAYKNYGENGVKMCHEWKQNFMEFYNWAVANGHRDGLEIDRHPNNKGDYEPNNCRWVSSAENQRNRTNNKLNWGLVREIRRLYSSGIGLRELSTKYNISFSCASRVVRNETWIESPLTCVN